MMKKTYLSKNLKSFVFILVAFFGIPPIFGTSVTLNPPSGFLEIASSSSISCKVSLDPGHTFSQLKILKGDSIDVGTVTKSKGALLTDSSLFGRATITWDFAKDAAILAFNSVTAADQASYTCELSYNDGTDNLLVDTILDVKVGTTTPTTTPATTVTTKKPPVSEPTVPPFTGGKTNSVSKTTSGPGVGKKRGSDDLVPLYIGLGVALTGLIGLIAGVAVYWKIRNSQRRKVFPERNGGISREHSNLEAANKDSEERMNNGSATNALRF